MAAFRNAVDFCTIPISSSGFQPRAPFNILLLECLEHGTKSNLSLRRERVDFSIFGIADVEMADLA